MPLAAVSRFLTLARSAALVCSLCGCAKDIELASAPAARIEIRFAPPTTLPIPTDLARDPKTGKLALPLPEDASAAEAAFIRFLNTLSGYPPSSAAEFELSGPLSLSAADIAAAVVVLVTDQRDLASPRTTRVPTEELVFSSVVDGEVTKVSIGRVGGWQAARSYSVFVLAADAGLRDADGRTVVRSINFELAAGSRPLCALRDPRIAPGESNPCIRSFSSLLRAQVEDELEEQAGFATLPQPEQSLTLNAAILEAATELESLRQVVDRLLRLGESAGLSREQVLVAWSFSTLNQGFVEYDPATGKLPGPANDLLLANAESADCSLGRVCLPAGSIDEALRVGLNSLDGFSTTAASWATLRGELQENSLSDDGWLALDVSTLSPAPIELSYDAQHHLLLARPTRPLSEGTRYAVVLISRGQSDDVTGLGLRDLAGSPIVASPTFALIRSSEPLFADGRSTVSSLSDQHAAALESIRRGLTPLFDHLAETGVRRDQLVAAWTFRTQSVSQPLQQLRALPWRVLAQTDAGQPAAGGSYDSGFAGFPAGIARANLAGWVADGSFVTLNARNTSGTFWPASELMQRSEPRQLSFLLTVPAARACQSGACPSGFSCGVDDRCRPEGGWPIVLYQHGFASSKAEMLALADAFGAGGLAVLASDLILHGERTRCRNNDDCDAGTCNAGRCDTKLVDFDEDGVPDASGLALFDLSNPFAIRDALRQQVIDVASLVRMLSRGGLSEIAGLPQLDGTRVSVVGRSLGAMLAVPVLAVESLPLRGVLNDPGAPIVRSLSLSPLFAPLIEQFRAQRGIEAGSPADRRLLAILQWVLDPADPANFAASLRRGGLQDLVTDQPVPAKEAFVQIAANNQEIPPALAREFANWSGAPASSFAGQGQSLLLRPDPSANATAAARLQAVEFLLSGKVCSPNLERGSCE